MYRSLCTTGVSVAVEGLDIWYKRGPQSGRQNRETLDQVLDILHKDIGLSTGLLPPGYGAREDHTGSIRLTVS